MKITITKELLSDLLAIERFIAKLPDSEQHKSFIISQRKRAILADLQALSLSLELSFSERELKNIYAGKEVNLDKHPTRAIRNSISAIKFLDTQKDLHFSLESIKHINKLLSDGYVEFWEEGKMRGVKEMPSLENDSFRNRPQTFVLEAFNQIKFINTNDDIEHPLLKGILFLYYYLLSYPFMYFNLQTALICFYGILRQTPYTAKGVVPLIATVFQTLNKQQLNNNPEEDLTHFAKNITKSFLSYSETVSESMEQRETIPEDILSGLNERQLKALNILKRKRKLSRRKYAIMNNVAIATAFRDLKFMVDNGLAVTTGVGRGTYYMLADLKKNELTETKTNDTMGTNEEYEELNSLEELN